MQKKLFNARFTMLTVLGNFSKSWREVEMTYFMLLAHLGEGEMLQTLLFWLNKDLGSCFQRNYHLKMLLFFVVFSSCFLQGMYSHSRKGPSS